MYLCSVIVSLMYFSSVIVSLIYLSRVIVSLMMPYLCLQLRMCSALAEWGSLSLMQRVCSWNLDLRLRLVCFIFDLWQVLNVRFQFVYSRFSDYLPVQFLEQFLWKIVAFGYCLYYFPFFFISPNLMVGNTFQKCEI